MKGVEVAAVGVLSGWGEGIEALPDDARRAARGRRVVPVATPALVGDRFRRATRECLLGVAAVDALLRRAGLARECLRGSGTALVYVTAGAYGASNRAFVEAMTTGGGFYFPYTAPSVMAAEVAIEFGMTGGYVILIGGAATTVDALWQAAVLIGREECERALVVAVETFSACEDLYTRARWLPGWPLVEAAACALLVRGERHPVAAPASAASTLEVAARRRAGETFSCGPLIALALALESGAPPTAVTGEWRGRREAFQLASMPTARG